MNNTHVRFVLDRRTIEASAGASLLEAAELAGIYIPRLCSRPELSSHGSCRVCTCLVNGRAQAACTLPVSEGMIVESESERVLDLRRSIVEMLLVEGNHFCMICERSGDCELQAVAYRLGITAPRHRYFFIPRPIDHSHSEVYLDHNRCILCGRCVRAAQEIDHKTIFQFIGRGPSRRIGVGGRSGLGSTSLRRTDAAVGACPVGALHPKHEGYLTPVGKRTYDRHPIGFATQTQAPSTK